MIIKFLTPEVQNKLHYLFIEITAAYFEERAARCRVNAAKRFVVDNKWSELESRYESIAADIRRYFG